MLSGTVFFSGRDWLPAALTLVLVATAGLAWAYRRAPASRGIQAACLLLKILGFAALFFCLLEPLWSGQRARPGANYFAVIADNSEGMGIKDRGATRTRGELLREMLTTDKSAWQGKLEEQFQVRRYLFDSRLQFIKSFTDLSFEGRASAVGAALKSVADRYRGQPLAGVLLLTDGNATDLRDGLGQLPGLPPVYPVVVGTDAPVRDVALQKVTVTQTAFEDAPVAIQADVNTVGYARDEIVAQLAELADDGRAAGGVESARAAATGHATNSTAPARPPRAASELRVRNETELVQRAPGDNNPVAFRFQVRPEKSGVTFYRLRVAAKKEAQEFTNPQVSTEATLANNTRIVAVDRGQGPYRVLYAAGRPNWEYKFLHRAIDEDDQVQLDAMIRIAKREPKMEFRGRAGESSNPLFRGFGSQSKEEVEQYDQPVVRWLVARDDGEAHEAFPKTAEELYRYQAIILDDLEADFFTHDQMVLLQKFVSERGGGFLMLGGQESFQQGNYERSPIADLLPVYLDRNVEYWSTNGFHLDLTKEGWLQPWARLRNNEADERKRLEEMPAFLVLNQVRDIKPGASAIATVTDTTGKVRPALVVQRFGNGRSAALTIGDFWHWGLKDKELHRDMDKAWRQLVRWLVSDVPNRIDLHIEAPPSDPDQAVHLLVRARDEKFQPLDSASVSVVVHPVVQPSPGSPEGGPGPGASGAPTAAIRLTAEPSPTDPGLYQATYIPRLPGGYLAEAVVTNSIGAEAGRSQGGWTSDPAAEEYRSLQPNRALLEELAKKTGGEVVSSSGLDAFVAGLPQRKAPITEDWSVPLWHQPTVFLLALGCFVAEWGLRRWKGLP